VLYLCDHGESYEVGEQASNKNDKLFTTSEQPRPLVDDRRDEPFQRAELRPYNIRERVYSTSSVRYY